jgi:hypothetical protein
MGVPIRNPEVIRNVGPALESSSPHSQNPPQEVTDSSVQNFSIVVGGPVYDFLLRLGLVRFGLPNIVRRIVALIAVTWLPLLVLSWSAGLAFGNKVRIPLLYDFSVYGRFLLALPMLILAEVVIDPSIQRTVAEFIEARIVKQEDIAEFDRILQKTQKLRNSAILEITLLVLAFFPVFLFWPEWAAGSVSSWHTRAGSLTAAGWWFALFSTPLMRFIDYRWAYRYFVWGYLLWRISRLRLVLMPTHPDHAAGLNFLSMAQKKFGILFCATGCVFAGAMANRIVFEGQPVASFKFLVGGFLVLSVVMGLLPLLLLGPKLVKVRRAGLLEYGRLANTYTTSFDKKWVHYAEPAAEPLLGTGDIQSLADLGNSFAFIENMTIVPITKRLIIQLAVQAAIPLIPVIVIATPMPELLRALMKMMI